MPVDLAPTDPFLRRHVGPSDRGITEMLRKVGVPTLDDLVSEAIPKEIRMDGELSLPEPLTEFELLQMLKGIAADNRLYRSFIGMGYYDTITPPVIQRNVLENPNWYTQYTPYQAEIAQGRLEALLNFQTMVSDLTGLEIANASLLDEATAAAEAMIMFKRQSRRGDRSKFFVAENCHPQTIAVVRTRALPLGIDILVGRPDEVSMSEEFFGALLQYPATDGAVLDYTSFCGEVHDVGGFVAVATDLMSLALLVPPGEFGADAAVGSSQRFGVPMMYGGPHAAFLSTTETFKRSIPGRLIGVTVDANGDQAFRMALQTREQHIRRDKATSNICTAQVLLAIMASMYAVYHGPRGVRRIAERIHDMTRVLARGLEHLGFRIRHHEYFDTLRIDSDESDMTLTLAAAAQRGMNLRSFEDGSVGISLDETVSAADIDALFEVFSSSDKVDESAAALAAKMDSGYKGRMVRRSAYLEHPVFNSYQSETDMMRYLNRLSSRDLSLTTSMIPLGSCTMKLNAAAELMPVSWSEFSRIHPFAPADQAKGYSRIISDLESWLADITGFAATSLQPNSGASGEYAGLLAIRAYHESRGEPHRNICLIPESAHGTNPASAVMAGMSVVVVKCDEAGDIDLEDLGAKAMFHTANLAALMITYPSTHGVFEETIREICEIVHDNGGQVYLDGANMNAQVGLCRPGDYGADVCHLNLHKTFSIPHGGGGPGIGPICVAEHLETFLPGHTLAGKDNVVGPVAAAPYGSAGILPISWAYIAMMGSTGLRRASEVAMLNANYLATRLGEHYEILYRGKNGRVAHEFIVDLRPFRQTAGVSEFDVAKRLMDYGFHAPTMSWPVAGTMMIEPTESESKRELDRFCDAMISIREEIREIETGIVDREVNVLHNAPHTAKMVASDHWDYPYSREQAAFPSTSLREHKFWPAVRRVDDAYGDRHLICTCPPIEAYASEPETLDAI